MEHNAPYICKPMICNRSAFLIINLIRSSTDIED